MEDINESAPAAARRDRVVMLLARYPKLDSDELADLLRWFRREASALDVGLIASDPDLTASYESLKKDHLDRITGADVFWVTMLVGTGFAALAAMVWSAM